MLTVLVVYRYREAMDAGDTDNILLKLTPAEMYDICKKASEKICSGDRKRFIDETMPELGDGIKYYNNRRVEKEMVAEVDRLLAEAKPSPSPEAQTALDRFDVDVFFSRGRRVRMEDRHVIMEDFNNMMDQPAGTEPQAFFAVYDGHGGYETAKYVQAHLHHNIAAHPDFHTDIKKALHEAFLSTDKSFEAKADREALRSGSTAVVAFVRGRKLYLAWAGDSQAMLIKNGEPHHLTEPHKPEREDEKKRIADAGGIVINRMGTWRVNAMLAVSRSFGDMNLKSVVPALPDIVEQDLDASCEYLILACDGLWDFMEKEKVVSFIKEWEEAHKDDGKKGIYGLSKSLVEHCIDTHEGTDNVSIIVVKLKNLDKDIWTSASA
ncbi:hypothetical protein PTSG_00335 [Salpingoeca rosetta]|uniref:PPM-type phosphatase domain-containing protein n=1 Tax=Salpingoeca rosetta (strain ATCC 50818 / BSB-021) TaxID=946362 RepID=F2TW71_SALR5|nr:uncharacterized protein PTSG_00335 [Salpingoeca rosetta]EGD72317.1 hypothetical protein PTSG_00335 [Salpingoeca rosetta]|eukprot:XP_004998887.1 hypothetical protein PTSG_00335 [Salpingoeca rosetta]